MKQNTLVHSRRLAASPDPEAAVALLHEIAGQSVRHWPRQVDKPLAIYGAGAFGKLAKDYCDLLEIPIAFVVDADADSHRTDAFWKGVSLLAPDDVAASAKSSMLLAICVGKSPYTRVVAPLAESGWVDMVPFYTITAAYMDRHPLNNGWFTGDLSRQDIDGIEAILRRYDDDMSRAHHIQFLAWHRLHEEWFFDDAPVETENRYFIPEIVAHLGEDEAFLDLGAHHGGVVASFLNRVGHRFRELWAVEPDGENFFRLRRCIDDLSVDEQRRIHLLPCAVGRENQTRRFFDSLDFASQFCTYGNVEVQVRTVDDLDVRPTFIKAHLEGAEMDAILGGINTIRKNLPLVALSVYHNRLGLWECPKTLMDTFGDCGYRFVFRLHSWHGTGAVLYLLNR